MQDIRNYTSSFSMHIPATVNMSAMELSTSAALSIEDEGSSVTLFFYSEAAIDKMIATLRKAKVELESVSNR